MMVPHIVKSIRDDQGKIIRSVAPESAGQVISEATAADMLRAMESVVTEGSGKKAYVPGYRIGGKTGTANKLINGAYDTRRVYSSFAAIAPVDNPRIALLVVVDEPKAGGIHFGSLVAAPIAHEILRDTLGYLEIPPHFEGTVKEVTIPDLKGKSLEEARRILVEKKLDYVLPDNLLDETVLMVSDQYPKAGDRVFETTRVILYPARRDAGPQ
jgi:stage V sporulation protein D (sporulation-specific penicillin-binding protein)